MDKMNIAKELKEYREDKRYTQKMLFEYLGVSQQVYSNIENGKIKRLETELHNKILYLVQNKPDLVKEKGGKGLIVAVPSNAENINHMVRSTDENIALLKGLEEVNEGESLRRYFKGQGMVISKLDKTLGITYQQINNYLQMEEVPDHFKLLLKDKMHIDFTRDVLQGSPSVSLQQMKMPELFDGVYKYLAEIQKRIS